VKVFVNRLTVKSKARERRAALLTHLVEKKQDKNKRRNLFFTEFLSSTLILIILFAFS
jgi:hypothetical protein